MNKVTIILQKEVQLPDVETVSIQEVANFEHESSDGRLPEIVVWDQRGFTLTDIPETGTGVYEEVLTAFYHEPIEEKAL